MVGSEENYNSKSGAGDPYNQAADKSNSIHVAAFGGFKQFVQAFDLAVLLK